MEWHELMALAARQHGVFRRAQARELGIDRQALGRRVAAGELVVVTPIVLRLAGAPDTPDQIAMAAVLDAGPGAALSHDTVLARLGIPGYRQQPIQVWRVRGRSNHEPRLGIQHKTRSLPPEHLTTLRNVPMTTPARAFVDKAATLHPGRAGRLLDDLWGRNLVNYGTVDQVLARLSRQGRTGLVLARDLLTERGPDYRPPQSALERRVMRLLEDARLRGFQRQVDTSGAEGWIGRVDFRHVDLPLILEVQSELYHEGLSNRRDDAVRLARLRHAGFCVLELLEFDIWYRPAVLTVEVDRAMRLLDAA